MKNSTRLIGYPFYKDDKIPCVCMHVKDDLLTYVYQDGKDYYIDTINSEELPLSRTDVFVDFNLHAKVISVKRSIDIFGGAQRKNDVKESVLEVVNYEIIDSAHTAVTLLTGRLDGVSVKMIHSDIEFIFPTIQKKRRNKKEFIDKGSVVIAIRDSSDGMFKRGDIFDVLKNEKHEIMSPLNLLHLSNGKKEVITYSKYFKTFK